MRLLRMTTTAGITAALLSASGIALAAVPTPFATTPFADVPATHANEEAIEYLRKNNVLKGYLDGTFKPDARINRAEFVKLITNPYILDTERVNDCIPEHVSEKKDTIFFFDVPRDAWYGPEVCLAKVKDIVNGYPDGSFRPGNFVNFVEAAKILSNVFALNTDESEDQFWYRPYVEKLSELQVIPLSVREFGETITRGEMAEMLYRLKADVMNKTSRKYSELY